MKRLLLICTLCAFTLGVFAQQAPTSNSKTSTTKHVAKETKYICPKCGYTASERGDCPTDHVALIKEGSYYCKEHPNEVSTQPGKCPQCGAQLTKMTASKSKS